MYDCYDFCILSFRLFKGSGKTHKQGSVELTQLPTRVDLFTLVRLRRVGRLSDWKTYLTPLEDCIFWLGLFWRGLLANKSRSAAIDSSAQWNLERILHHLQYVVVSQRETTSNW